MISVRPAVPADARDLFEWRNDSATRSASLDREAVRWEDHLSWFERSLASASRRIFLAEDDGVAIGMVRFDNDDATGTIEVSINLAPAVRGTGRSGAVLAAGIAALTATRPQAVLTARIRDDNLPSIRLFAAAGFHLREASVDGVGSYVRD